MATKKKQTTPTQESSKDKLIIMLISILLGIGLGFGIAQVSSEDSNSTDTATSSETSHSHSEKYEVSAEQAPKVELVVSEDAKSGYNIKIVATDFVFTPEGVNGENVIGEGHAHLYVDGEKVARLYSPYFHWDGSFEGTKEFRVTLNANDHSEYAVDGEVIEVSQTVTHDSDAEGHDEMHMMDSNEESHDHSDM